MNAVEIEEEVSQLANMPFDVEEFPYLFLEAFGNKTTTLKKLRSGVSNKSDKNGCVLQRNNIHIGTCKKGLVTKTLLELKQSPLTSKFRAKFVLSTDGEMFEAEDLTSGETISCDFCDFPDYFGFFLSLAGISTVKQIRESTFDIRATGRLNKLYIELIRVNPEWGTAQRREEMNHFMARLIFCFFAEDTDIFGPTISFTNIVDQMSERDSSNTHEIISEIYRAMNIPTTKRKEEKIPRWADSFPYVNGGLFAKSVEVPKFTKIARSYLLHIGNLDWTKINPDIFGSMIQAVAEDEERGSLGLHYTSVPNILKVLNPLILDELHQKLLDAGDNYRKLLNLRNRISRIRIFDPACGSGNFLVVAYKKLRFIEDEINRRRGELGKKSQIPLTNFRGIEIRSFPAEIARLALIIAEYQCNENYLGQQEALAEFLPLEANNWIICGNALRLDWSKLCPLSGVGVKLQADDLFSTPLDQSEIDFDNQGGEIFICGNPPYLGYSNQDDNQKDDLKNIFELQTKKWKIFDYVSGWFAKAAMHCRQTKSKAAFVSTNSICQGQHVPTLWPIILNLNVEIYFAYTSFKWSNLATHNAGVTVSIIALSLKSEKNKQLYIHSDSDEVIKKVVKNINAYLVPYKNIYVNSSPKPINSLQPMDYGSKPADGGYLSMSLDEKLSLESEHDINGIVLPYIGSKEYIDGLQRFCLWIDENNIERAMQIDNISERVDKVRRFRLQSKKKPTRESALKPHCFTEIRYGSQSKSTVPFIIPRATSENRDYLPVGFLKAGTVISDSSFAMYDAPLWHMAIIASRMHLIWIKTVCGKLETRFRYSNTLGWNTYPIPKITQKNKDDLTECVKNILLAREANFPATIRQLYEQDKMPMNLKHAHLQNDEVLERIYIGRRFKNDTERLEKLFDMYSINAISKGLSHSLIPIK